MSKVFPHRAFAYALAVVPGLFFEIAIAVGNPGLVESIQLPPRQLLKLSPYFEVVVALVFAFLVGNLAMDSVAMIQFAIRRFLMFKAKVIPFVCARIIVPRTNKLMTKPWWNRKPIVVAFHVYAINHSREDDSAGKKARLCWDDVAKKLLHEKYGVEVDDLEDEKWQHLYWNLGDFTMADLRGDVLVMALHASAWCGLAAAWIAPSLRNRYFLTFCGLALLIGLIHDYDVARRLSDPVLLAHARIRAVLRQYKWPKTSVQPPSTT